jgi:hypothetical protein
MTSLQISNLLAEIDAQAQSIKELKAIITVLSRHATAMMEVLTSEQIAACVKYPSSNNR